MSLRFLSHVENELYEVSSRQYLADFGSGFYLHVMYKDVESLSKVRFINEAFPSIV